LSNALVSLEEFVAPDSKCRNPIEACNNHSEQAEYKCKF